MVLFFFGSSPHLICVFSVFSSLLIFSVVKKKKQKKTKKTNGPGGFCDNLSAWAFQLFRQEVRIWRIQHWLYIVKLMANYSDFIRIFREGLSSSFNFRYFLYSFLKSVHWLRMTGAEDSLLLSLYILNLFWNFLKGISKFMLKCHGFVHVINSYFVFSLLPPFSGTRRGSLRLQTSRLESPCLFLARVSVLMPP